MYPAPSAAMLATASAGSPVVGATGNGRLEHSVRHLPIERDGVTQYVPVDDIVAVSVNSL